MIKNAVLSLSGLVIFTSFTSQSASAQGEAVARDLRSYIEAAPSKALKAAAPASGAGATYHADDVHEASPSADPGILPQPHHRDPVVFRPEEHISINGQEIDESNNVVYKAFEEHPEWKDVAVVADWTGSMYPYAGQVMRWHKLNMDRHIIKYMVLFNDGDDHKRGAQTKDVGKTGGLYYPDPDNLDDFLEKVKVAVDAGDGGESEENDLEAVKSAIDKYPDAGAIVLVADNSSVRDMELLKSINKPVHVILVNGGWVKDYIKIAAATGGTVTTLQESLDFSKEGAITEGVVQLNGLKYKVQ